MGANWRGTKSRTRYENILDFKLQDVPLYINDYGWNTRKKAIIRLVKRKLLWLMAVKCVLIMQNLQCALIYFS